MLTSARVSRLKHKPVEWVPGEIVKTRRGDRFVIDVTLKNGRTWNFVVEAQGQRRLLEYSNNQGYGGTLIHAERRKYWDEHGAPPQNQLRKAYGLPLGF